MSLIRFEHIPEVGLSLEKDYTADFLTQLLEEPNTDIFYKALAPAHVKFRLERQNKDVLITGGGLFLLSHPCVRCLEDVTIQHQLVFDLKLEKPETINLQELLREELFLELPTYPTCEKACLSDHHSKIGS